jgi:monoamine oxidase
MGRTPLFREFRRALRTASYLERHGLPTAEFFERRAAYAARPAEPRPEVWNASPGAAAAAAARGFSRRSFLQGAAVAGAAGILRPGRARAGEDAGIVIVGAGAAGLTCAWRLQQRGFATRVIEASTRVGGRMYSLRNTFPDGQLTELGGELIDSDHRALLGLAKELGLTPVDLAYVDTTQGNLFHFGGKVYPNDSHLLDAFRPLAAKVLEDLGEDGGNGGVWYEGGSEAGIALDRMSLAEWLQSRGFTGLIGDVVRVAYIGEYGLEPEEQSALNLLTLVGTEAPPVDIYGSSDERYHLKEGNDAVPMELARRLARPVELGTELRAVKRRSDGGYTLTVARGESLDEIRADRVVLALPFTVLRHVEMQVELPDVKRKAIAELGYGTNAKLLCGFGRRVWTAAGATGAVFTDLGFQMSWETTRAQAGQHGIITNFLGGKAGASLHQGATEEHARRFAGQFDKVFQGAAGAFTGQAVRFSWPTHRHTLGSYTCYRPGQWAGIAGAEAFAVDALHFAGEHTSSRFSGFMNGAVESGERVAQELLAGI